MAAELPPSLLPCSVVGRVRPQASARGLSRHLLRRGLARQAFPGRSAPAPGHALTLANLITGDGFPSRIREVPPGAGCGEPGGQREAIGRGTNVEWGAEKNPPNLRFQKHSPPAAKGPAGATEPWAQSHGAPSASALPYGRDSKVLPTPPSHRPSAMQPPGSATPEAPPAVGWATGTVPLGSP